MTVDDLDVTIHFVKENAIVSRDSRSSDKFLHGIKVLMAKNYVDNLSEEAKKRTAREDGTGTLPVAGTCRLCRQPGHAPHRGRPGPQRSNREAVRVVRERPMLRGRYRLAWAIVPRLA